MTPNISAKGTPFSGLTFSFISNVVLRVKDIVSVENAYFSINNIGLFHKDNEIPKFLYTVNSAGYFADSPELRLDFDLREFNGKPVVVITDETEIKKVRVASTYC